LLRQSRTKLQTDSGEQDDADVDTNANDDGEDQKKGDDDREATVTTSKWFTERVNTDLARELEAIDGKVCHFRLDGTTIPVDVERIDIGKDSQAPSKALDYPGMVRVSDVRVISEETKKKRNLSTRGPTWI